MKDYKIPRSLSPFQKKLYMHLIDWKWRHVTEDEGYSTYRGSRIAYDAIIPERLHSTLSNIYPRIRDPLIEHNKAFRVKIHRYFHHMASSQAAAVNLFLPILNSPLAEKILNTIKPDLKTIARDHLFSGFRFEYWDGIRNNDSGLLGDHNARSGTDADIAIAYRNQDNELCLWLIEHKLGEKEFTDCGGYEARREHGSDRLCAISYKDIMEDHGHCYYNSVRHTKYWEITSNNKDIYTPCNSYETCPFRGGVNQLWRNQLLGLAIVSDSKTDFKHMHLSVVKHPQNASLDKTINQYKAMISDQSNFSVFDSNDIIAQARMTGDKELVKWSDWYQDLYLDF